MKKILVLGAGKSAATIISYLLENANKHDWKITVGDLNYDLAKKRVAGNSRGQAIAFNVKSPEDVQAAVANADIVASLLPAVFHPIVANACVNNNAHLVTASYVDESSKALDEKFKAKGLLFMGEIGLDPGIDHLGLMKILDELKGQNAKITGVYSHCGALIHPDDDTNPWHYKFTWAPMNVVKAGQGVSMYLYNGQAKYVPYGRLFSSFRDRTIDKLGDFEIYPNRDSLQYLDKYHLEGLDNFMRGTIRWKGYCQAWNAMIKLGFTDDSYQIDSAGKTYTDLLRAYLPLKNQRDKKIKEATADFLDEPLDGLVMRQLDYLQLFDERAVKLPQGSPAQILCHLLQDRWKLGRGDRDMIVMLHEIDYELNGERRRRTANMVAYGADEEHTAISKTVGLPAAMMVKLIAEGKTKLTGVHIPTIAEVYEPILAELEEHNIIMKEEDSILEGNAL